MTQYKVWTLDVNGTWIKYQGESKEQFDTAIAKLEAENDRARASKSPWGPKVREYFTEITEDEQPTEEIEATETSDVVEQSVEASIASTEIETEDASEVESPYQVVIIGGKENGAKIGRDTLAEAKEELAARINRGPTQMVIIHEGRYLRGIQGCYWDAYDEYCRAWDAGAFNGAFKRDIANEEALHRGK